jgi:hypothetical protein
VLPDSAVPVADAGPIDKEVAMAKATSGGSLDAGSNQSIDAELFPHSLVNVRPSSQARPQGPALTMPSDGLERRLPKTTAIYSAPAY